MLFNICIPGCRTAGLIFYFLASVFSAGAEIRLVGSDLLGPGLSASLQDFARRTGTSLITDFAGSHPGWRELQDGYADLGLLAFPPGQPWPSEPYVCLPLAYHVALVLVSEALPLEQLSWPHLAGIFGAGGAGRVGRWGELGLSGEWTARAVLPRMCEDGGGLSAALFRHLVLHDRDYQPAVVRSESMESLLDELARTRAGGIALAPVLPPAGRGIKSLLIARTEAGPAASPTPENVHQGDYPLRWPVCLVFRRTDASRLRPLVRHLMGREIAHKCSQAGPMIVA